MYKFWKLNRSSISIELKMFDHGWATLNFKYDQLEISIDLSDVYDPFQDLVNLGWNIQQNILPTSIEIDEEGHVVKIVAENSIIEDQLIIRFIAKSFTHTIKVNKYLFLKILRQEIKHFFEHDFNQNEWEEIYPVRNLPFSCINDWVLNHTWINQNEEY